jgi:two-component system sensor histidine kinase VanS
MPSFYYNYKVGKISDGLHSVTVKLKKSNGEEAVGIFNAFSEKYNVTLAVKNAHGQNLYFKPSGYRMNEGKHFIELPFIPDKESIGFNNEENRGIYKAVKKISIKGFEEDLYLFITTPLQPIDEATEVLTEILPYLIIIMILISIIAGFVYSFLVSKPLLNLNKVAGSFSKLDFTAKASENNNDEIGELATNLNIMARNLRDTMDKLKSANEKLQDDITKERALEAERREFIAAVSHELKTPITVLSGQLEGMIENIGSFKDRDKYLVKSHQITKNMEKLVQEILEIYKVENRIFNYANDKIPLEELINEVLKDYEFFINDKDLKVETKFSNTKCIIGDNGLIKKVLSNLISNAIYYTPLSGIVKLETFENGDIVEFSVFNSGVTFSDEDLKSLAKPFYRLEKSRNRTTGGSGLGLHLVKIILNKHNVKYEISNHENGVLFKIWFKNQ